MRSSPGPSPLQGFLSCCVGTASAVHPLLQLTYGHLRPSASTSGFFPQQAWLVFLKTAFPLGVYDLLIHHARLIHAVILESPPKTLRLRYRSYLLFFEFSASLP
jgi:hypothetical protein